MSEHDQQTYIANKPRFFISYARDDGEAYAKELRAKLVPIFGEKSIWRDREGIIANNESGWWKQITDALDNVEYMLLIASPKAMASSVVRKEIHYARSKGVTVCPILLPDKNHYPDFKNLPFGISEKHFYDLTHQWETLIGQLKQNGITTKIPFSAPDMPKNFVQRPDIFNRLKSYLLAQSAPDAPKNPVTISTALKGAGGFGKTVMATALAYDEDIQNAYLDGIVWVELGETPDLTDAMNKIYNQLAREKRSFTEITDAQTAIKDLIATKNILLVVDDVWKAYHVQPFLDINPKGATLVTTRYVDVVLAANADAHRIDVDEMKPEEAVELLMSNIAHKPTTDVTKLAERLGNWALMMTLANAMLRKRLQRTGATFADALDWVNEELDDEGVISIGSNQIAQERNQSAGKTIEISFRALDEGDQADARARYLALGIFPEGATIPKSALYRLWGCKERRAEKYAEQLDDLSLVKYNVSTESLTLHDVVWKYAQETLGEDAQALHNRLIEAYGNLHDLPDDYGWRNIAYHLIGANQAQQLRELLLTYGWLDKKLRATDANTLLNDCDLLLKQGKDETVRLIRSAISMSSHVLDVDENALAHQLAGRLMHHYTKVDEIRAFLDIVMTTHNNLFPAFPDSEYDIMNPAGGMMLRTMKHEDIVRGAIQLRDGRILSWAGSNVFSKDNTLRLWDADGSPLATLTGHTNDVNGAIELGDGRILSWGDDATLRLWDRDGHAIRPLTGHTRRVWGAIQLADGRLLSWSVDNTLRLWDSEGHAITKLTGHTNDVNGAIELGDGRILSWGDDATLRLWDSEGHAITKLTGHTDKVWGAIELSDGRLLSWAGGFRNIDYTLRLWDSEGHAIATLTGHTNDVNGAIELGDGRLLSWSRDATLRLWDSEGHAISVLTGHTSRVAGAIELRDGRILSWSGDATLCLWDSDGTPIATLTEHTASVNGAIELRDGRLLSWGEDKTLRLWDREGHAIATLMGHMSEVNSAIELRDGRLLSWAGAQFSKDTTLCLWDREGHAIRVLTEHTDVVISAIELGDGRLLSWSRDATLCLWDREGHAIATLTGHKDRVVGAMQLADGRLLSWGEDYTLRLWDREGHAIATLMGHMSEVQGAMQLADGRLLSWAGDPYDLYVKSYDNTLRLWDSDGHAIATLTGHKDRVVGAIQLANGRLLSWSADANLKLWDSDGHDIRVLRQHMRSVNGAIELRDGRLLSWSQDNTLRLWDSEGHAIAELTGHTDNVVGAIELGDGRLLSWAGSYFRSKDNTLRLWDSDGTPIDVLEQDYYDGDRQIIGAWAQKYRYRLDDFYPPKNGMDFLTAGGRVKWHWDSTDLIIYDPQTGATIHTFHGDAPFKMKPVVLDGGRVLVAGDRMGRVLFLRWVGENAS